MQRWRLAARALWIGVTLFMLILYLHRLTGGFAHSLIACDSSNCQAVMPMGGATFELLPFDSYADFYARYLTLIKLATYLVWIGVSALILWRRDSAHVGRDLFVAVMLVIWGSTYDTNTERLAAIYGDWALTGQAVSYAGAVMLQVFCYIFPDGRFVPRRMLPVFLVYALIQVPAFFWPQSPLSLFSWPALPQALLGAVMLGSTIVAQVYRYRRHSGTTERIQTKWVISGLALAAFVALVSHLTKIYVPSPTPGQALLLTTVESVAQLTIPVSIGFAILRYRLWEIDLLINRALVYGALTVSVGTIYVLVVGALGLMFQAQGSMTIALIGTGLVAVMLRPLHERLQGAVNRLMYGERVDPYTVVARLGQRLEATLQPGAVLPTIVDTVRESLRVPYAAIRLRQGESFAVASAAGEPSEPLLDLPLIFQGETIGQLLVSQRAADYPFSPADQHLLEGLARQAGVAVHDTLLHADLQRSRERLVSVLEEERRRLRRDLHDGLGPLLAVQRMKVSEARDLVTEAPAQAAEILGELESDLHTAMAEIRRLVYNLRPPMLDERGLAGAILQTAEVYRTSLEVTVSLPEMLPALPAAVEVAAFRIVQEALVNVTRHARARHCTIAVTADEALHLRISDDGVGLDPHRLSGVGLHSMRERAQELGGSCQVESSPGAGTIITVKLPLPQEGASYGDRSA